MTKKTRIRVARIAAGAVIAAGASLTAAGAASAAETDDCLLGILCADESPVPTPPPTDVPTDIPTDVPTDLPTDLPTDPPPTAEPTDEPTEPTEEPTEPTEDPTAQPTDPGNGNGNGGGNGGGNGNGGNNGGGGNIADPDGGTAPQQEGSSSLTDTGADATPAAPQAQGNGQELAETGAAQTTFLVIGAATMIAGGIGFRVLPRLVGGRGGAAA
ncbi:hypothetical protein ABT373_07040 [Streptomyces sp. NPDC000070]|uniref:hypothetical protein n=1 Tax=Streptomyces sp. NPDC000070 TaxID=3154240 RepID=UPI00332B3FD8